MKAHLRALVIVALGAMASTVFAVACGPNRDPYPHPQGGPNVLGSPTGGTTPPSTDLCGCAATLGVDPANLESCATCFNDKGAFSSSPCGEAVSNCLASPGCTAISVCVSDCGLDPPCVFECMLPFDKDDAHQLWEDVLTCSCSECAEKCQNTAITCDTVFPDAGAGGGDGGP